MPVILCEININGKSCFLVTRYSWIFITTFKLQVLTFLTNI